MHVFCCTCTSADPVILVNPKEVSNQTSATLSCNLTNPVSTVKGYQWKKNDKVVDDKKDAGAVHFIEHTYVLITLTNPTSQRFAHLMLLVLNIIKP